MPQADDGTMSGRWLCVWEGDYRMDVVRSYHLPWGIIATLDLYPMLTRVERARIHRWLEAAIEANATIGTKYSDQPWITSEYLIALKYLANGRSPTSARVPASSP